MSTMTETKVIQENRTQLEPAPGSTPPMTLYDLQERALLRETLLDNSPITRSTVNSWEGPRRFLERDPQQPLHDYVVSTIEEALRIVGEVDPSEVQD